VVTRRGVLAAGAAAVAAGGCGAADGGRPERASEAVGGASSPADAALLDDALGAERRVAGVLPSSRDRVRALEREILRRGGHVDPPPDRTPPPADPEAAAAELVALYVDVIPKLSEPALRGVFAGLLAGAARAGAQARADAGRDPAPEPFVAGRGPA
jgi:hypothetical protein